MSAEFVDELPSNNRLPNGAVAATVAELRTRPGEWAKVMDDAAYGASQYWKSFGCEVATRANRVDDKGRRRCTLYARWPTSSVGGGNAPSARCLTPDGLT